MAGSLVPIDQHRPADLTQAVHFGHNYPEAGPPTPGKVRPDAVFVRKVFNDKLEFSDGNDVEYWAFKDPDDDKPFPSTPIRARQGQVVHLPPGEEHWHGAVPGGTMTHLSITTGGPAVWNGPPTPR